MQNLSGLSRLELEKRAYAVMLAKQRNLLHEIRLRSTDGTDSQEVKNLWAPQLGPQTAFSNCWADICIYGGSAGSGKTSAILMEPAKYVHVPGFYCVIFRRTSPQITNPGGLWDDSTRLYPAYGGMPVKGELEWRFPSGARIVFRHMEHDETRTHGLLGPSFGPRGGVVQ